MVVDNVKPMTCAGNFWANISEEAEMRRARNRMAQKKYEEELSQQQQRDEDVETAVKNLEDGDVPSTEGSSGSVSNAAPCDERPALRPHRGTNSTAGVKKKASTVSKSYHAPKSTLAIARQTSYAVALCSDGSTQGKIAEGGVTDENNIVCSGVFDPSVLSERMIVDDDELFLGTDVGGNVERPKIALEKANMTSPLSEGIASSTPESTLIQTTSKPPAPRGFTALQKAVMYGHEAIVSLLISKGADIESANHLGQRTLHLAAETGNVAIVRLLLEYGAEYNAVDISGATALHLAAEKGHSVVARILLREGAHIDAKDSAGCTALHQAARNGHDAVVMLLLNMGADINAKT